MNLLAAKLYDPAVAVSKSTAALLAMTAFDTTNLRLAVTVPSHGMVLFKIRAGAITGATTVPTILLGVLNGATIVARVTPQDYPGTMNAATQSCPVQAEFVVTGLTPGAINFDAAYGVEVIVASTSIKYGGPNDTTASTAWGGFVFEAWDPQPMETTFRTDYSLTRAAALDNLDATISSRSTYAGGAVASVTAAVDITQTAADRVWASTTRSLTTFGTLVADIWANATRTLTAVADSSGVTTLLGRLTATRSTNLDNLDATVSSRSTYAGGDTAGTTTLLGRVTATRSTNLDNLDAAVSSRLAGGAYTAPDNADIAAIKAKTDGLTFTKPGEVDANVQSLNDTTITGHGVAGTDPWGT